LRIAINSKYSVQEIIGKGSFGFVAKGVCRNSGREVALKVMVNQAKTEYDVIRINREISLMRKLNEIT